jgi:putative phosphoesterase
VLEDLREIGPPLEGIHGNMDEPELKELLPKQRVVEVSGVRIGMMHNPGPRNGREARLAARFADCQVVVYGHTHVPQVERFEDVWILNPGSPTERRTAPIHAMIELSISWSGITPELVTLTSA